MLPKHLIAVLSLGLITFALGQDSTAVTGVKVDSQTTGVPSRRSITELFNQGGAQWDLYVRALQALHDEDSADPLSYFQISGIHGKPFMEYNGNGAGNSNGWRGYCPHGELLFLPWHRPYVLLYEQALVSHARRIAQEYPTRYRSQYVSAAEALRAPFWDWALEPYVPEATIYTTVWINVPDGQRLRRTLVDNPLWTFRFPQEVLNGAYGDFDSQGRSRMYRCSSPESYPDSANDNVNDRPYRSWLYDTFTRAQNFSNFSSTGAGGISLEQIHNGIHWDAGCGGQFLDAEFSAFDPIFMLHHANVDRLWAYWQAIHPDDDNFEGSYSGGSRFSTPQGTTITPDSPLAPFRNTDGGFHTPQSVRSIEGFGYTYPELEYWAKSDDQLRSDSQALINRLYSGNRNSRQQKIRRDDDSEETTRYFVSVELDVTEVERPCSVDIYVGDAKAGGLVVMGQPASGTFHGALSLDEAIESAGMRRSGADATAKSTQDSLVVEIVKHNGERISVDSVPSLKVAIEDVDVTPPPTAKEFPSYGSPRSRPALLSLNLGPSLNISI